MKANTYGLLTMGKVHVTDFGCYIKTVHSWEGPLREVPLYMYRYWISSNNHIYSNLHMYMCTNTVQWIPLYWSTPVWGYFGPFKRRTWLSEVRLIHYRTFVFGKVDRLHGWPINRWAHWAKSTVVRFCSSIYTLVVAVGGSLWLATW